MSNRIARQIRKYLRFKADDSENEIQTKVPLQKETSLNIKYPKKKRNDQ